VNPDSVAFAAEFLREHDRDRYLSTLLLASSERQAVTAVYAFSADVAAVRERSKVPAAGEIRLQWWADALNGEGHGAVRQNPLADALLDSVAEYGLPIPGLVRLIEARRFDLYDDPMPDLATFEGYAGETSSSLYQLAAMILNRGPVESGDAAGHLGVAHALIGHLRAFSYNASRGRIILPWSVLAANGVTEEEVFVGTVSEGLAEALGQLAEMASEHLSKARSAIGVLPGRLRPAFGPIAVLGAQLKRLSFDATFQPQQDIADWRKIALLTAWRLAR
jgi:phytoene synthase